MILSNVYPWLFVRISEAYAQIYAVNRPTVVELPSCVYSDLIESKWVDRMINCSVPLGSRGGAVVRALAFHQCGLGSIPGPGIIRELNLLLVPSLLLERCGGLVVSAFDSRSRGPGSGSGRVHCVVFLGKTLYPHGASLHPGV